MTEFATPGSASALDLNNHVGALLLIEPLSHEQDINTVNGVKDAIRGNVQVVDGAGAPADYADVLIFPGKLIGQLKGRLGQKVLGRIGKGEAAPGKNAPWELTAATDADIATATAYLAKQEAASSAVPF